MRLAILIALCAFVAFSSFSTVSVIGKEREPLKASVANCALLINALIAAGIVELYR